MNMTYKDWLLAGLKVLGVVTIVNGLVQAIVTWGSLPSTQNEIPRWMLASSAAVPLVVLGAGLYLVLGTRGLVDRVYQDEEERQDSAAVIFMVAMKVLGTVLIVEALPDAIQIISSFIYIHGVSPVWDSSMQSQFIYQHFLSVLVKFALGCYLLLGGKWLQNVAFPPGQLIKTSDE